MVFQIIIFTVALLITVAFIYWLWWSLPKSLAARDAGKRTSEEKRESFYRLQASKALGGLLALGAFVVTVEQTVATQAAAVAARQRANDLTEYEHYQKALESLTKTGHSEVLHAGAMFALGSMAKASPELGKTVATELALAAMTYPAGVPASGGNVGPPPSISSTSGSNQISREAQIALSVLGELPIMQAGLPLQLAEGKFRGANLSSALLNGVQFPRADLSSSDLFHTQLYGANFRGAILSGTNMPEARLTIAGFYGAVLCEDYNFLVSHLNTGKPTGVQMAGAIADNADFQDAWLVGADLSSNPPNEKTGRVTNLEDANFQGASLKRANLRYSLLKGADFRDADLTDANLQGASEPNLKIRGVRLCRTVMPDGRVDSSGCPQWEGAQNSGSSGTLGFDKHDCQMGSTWHDVDNERRAAYEQGNKR